MKQLILLILLLPCMCCAQVATRKSTGEPIPLDSMEADVQVEDKTADIPLKKKEVIKQQYKKVVTFDLADAQILLNAVVQWKELIMYSPTVDSKDKEATYKELDAYIVKIRSTIKIDSVLVVQPIKKK